MMNSYRRNNHDRRLIAATALVAILFALDILSGGVLRHTAQRAAGTISSSFGSVAEKTGIAGFFTTRTSLLKKNRALSDEVASLQERAALASELASESNDLRALAHLAETSQGITAPVISSVISSPYGTFLIGAGSADGLRVGDTVLTGGLPGHSGFVVGTVSDVGAKVSVVHESLAPRSSEDAVLNGASVTVSGSGGGNAIAMLPRGTAVAVGDAVVSPRFGQRPLGVVGAVASSSAEAMQTVYIRLPVDIGALRFVYVVTQVL